MSRWAMIMAGGAGTRLWPMSRRQRPKQLIPFVGGRSLLQLAAERLDGVVEPAHRCICTGEMHRAAVRAALPDFDNEQIIGEPIGRDTVNAVGLTAAVLARRDADAVFAVLTSDHIIEPAETLQRMLDKGLALVEDDPTRFVTFAIKATFAATAYGWVKRGAAIDGFDGAFVADQFHEKPDEPTANAYLADATWGWNSGMFVFHAATFMAALSNYLPESARGLSEIADAWDTQQRAAVLERVYPALKATNVDKGVMERAARDERYTVCCVPMDVAWRDVGSWPAYAESLEADADGNRVHGQALLLDSSNVLAVSDDPNHLIATVGCDDLIIVRTADVTLVCRAADAQRVKDLAGLADEGLR